MQRQESRHQETLSHLHSFVCLTISLDTHIISKGNIHLRCFTNRERPYTNCTPISKNKHQEESLIPATVIEDCPEVAAMTPTLHASASTIAKVHRSSPAKVNKAAIQKTSVALPQCPNHENQRTILGRKRRSNEGGRNWDFDGVLEIGDRRSFQDTSAGQVTFGLLFGPWRLLLW